MISNLCSRPNFFTGQLIDYKDFNQLAKRPDNILGELLKTIYPGGGILGTEFNKSKNFEIQILDKLLIEIKPGVALLPNGDILAHNHSKLIDISSYIMDGKTKCIILHVKNVLQGDQKYLDPDDNTIEGYKSEIKVADFYCTDKTEYRSDDSTEVLRIHLPANTKDLRFISNEESWKTENEILELMAQYSESAIIDTRYRKIISPTLSLPLGSMKTLEFRKAIRSIKNSIIKLTKSYFIPDHFYISHTLSSLEAEILSQPYQPQKISFYISELAEKTSLFLEHLLNKTESTRSDFKRELAIKTIETLEGARQESINTELVCIDVILELNLKLSEMVNYSELNFSLSNTIREALLGIRFNNYTLEDKIILAGRSFQKVDSVQLANERRWSSLPAENHRRKITAQFKDSLDLTLEGAFIRNGRFYVQIEAKDSNRPLVLILKQHIRRAGTKTHYEFNGKTLESESFVDLNLENSWIHKGIVVPSELLVTGENQLSIQIEKSDLDFGFFGIEAYQATHSSVEQSI